MISKEQIETFARQIADPDFEQVNILPLIGHLSDSEFDAILDRAEEITRGYLAQARAEESLCRLARAAGCPGSAPMIPWLAERGLIDELPSGLGWRFKPAKPGAVK
jgi:hypothetical protein